jgi:hypothetical protein
MKWKLKYKNTTKHPMFTVALFTITKLWKQPRHPTTPKWIKKMWDIYPMEYYSAIKNYEILLFTGKWMQLENFMLSEVSQAQKVKGCMFSLIWEARPMRQMYTHAHTHIYIHTEREVGEFWHERE